MTRGLGLLLLVAPLALTLPHRSAHGEPFVAGSALDQTMVASVAAAAIGFMAPRTLEAIPQAQLSLWGLRGLATLDPRLIPERQGDQLRLSLFATPVPRLLLSRTLPAEGDDAAWGGMLAAFARGAWDASQQVRRVGTDGVLEVFFGEICNHLDAYSRYATPGEVRPARDLRADLGVELTPRRGGFAIASLAPGRPAAAAGLRLGELVVAVDGEPLQDVAPGDVATLLAGPDASTVVLSVRGRNGRLRDVAVARTVQPVRTVESSANGRLLLLRISGFLPQTGAELGQALATLGPAADAEANGQASGQTTAQTPAGRHGTRGVVIDLRGNRGGLLREAVAGAESLLADGVVAVTVGRDPAANHAFQAHGDDRAHGLPVVVLVDGGSASAAEILAAALADQHRAVVVGSSTVGKGLVQAVKPLPNGGELVLSWSRVLAPLGWPIQGLGVLPQVCTSNGPDAVAAQLAALDHGEQPMADALARHRAARTPVASAETLALRSSCPAAEGRDDDLTVARYLVEHPAAYQTALLGPPRAP